jgi:ubiquinone/menaquinone biosynthesis C-methylase UbiE
VANPFDLRANVWDTEYRIERAKSIAAEIRKRVPFTGNDKAIDFGCGTGLVSFNLLDAIGEITFIDNSQGMLAVLGEKLKDSAWANHSVVSADLFAKEHAEGTFDCIYTSMVLHHVADLESLGRRFHALLKKGGTLCVVDLTPDDGSYHREEKGFDGHNGFDPEALSRTFVNYGFVERYRNVFLNDTRMVHDRPVAYSLFILTMTKE